MTIISPDIVQVATPEMGAEIAETDPGFRTVLASPIDPYGLSTAAQGFSNPSGRKKFASGASSASGAL